MVEGALLEGAAFLGGAGSVIAPDEVAALDLRGSVCVVVPDTTRS
jgi:2-keto-3-deoxy-6-phosphogluconate aldolase